LARTTPRTATSPVDLVPRDKPPVALGGGHSVAQGVMRVEVLHAEPVAKRPEAHLRERPRLVVEIGDAVQVVEDRHRVAVAVEKGDCSWGAPATGG
jgi:hypothetical protein